MRTIKRVAAFIYLASGVLVLGLFAGFLFAHQTRRFEVLFQKPVVRIILLVCMCILTIGMLVTVARVLLHRRPMTCIHPNGDSDIEVSLSAVESVARGAAQDPEVLIEDVRGRVVGREDDAVRISVDAIALGDHDLSQHAQRIQGRVDAACRRMLGTERVEVRVRFLPSKTTITMQEAARE